MTKIYKWVIKENDPQKVEEITRKYSLSRVVSEVLVSRGITEVKTFLEPQLSDLLSPFLLKGIKEARELINKHLQEGNLITIYGDYDVDGITATSLMYLTLKKLGGKVDFYIPERISEGYGINEEAIEKIVQKGTKLVITVDCGITAVNEVKKAKSVGLEVVITDHHSIPEEIPQADMVVNPHLPGAYPFSDLAGVGVAFKLAQSLIGEKAFDFLDIVSLGTIADIVPLVGENRIIVKEGLKKLNETQNLGLKALIKASGLQNVRIDEYHVGFILAPRLNVAGRLKSAEAAVRLLISEDEKEVEEIARYLNEENSRRQNIENNILEEAVKKVEESVDLKKDKVIVLWDEKWHPGVIGIVSSRITEKYARPSILISLKEEEGKGSGRSIEGFNLYKGLEYCRDLLVKYGGHEMAGGLTIKKDNLDLFKKKINEYADIVLKDIDLIPTLKVDARAKEEKINIKVAKQLQELKPFGVDNPRPILLFEGLTVEKIFEVNNGKHVKIIGRKDDFVYELLIFDLSSKEIKVGIGDVIDVVGTVDINNWNGIESVVINVKDLRIRFPLFAYYKNLSRVLISSKSQRKRVNKSLGDIIDKRGMQDKERYVLRLFKSDRKTLVLVSTEIELRSLLRYLKIEKFYNFSVSTRYCQGKNVILFFPHSFKPCDFYDDIVMYDIPFDKELFYNIISLSDKKKVHLIFRKEDVYNNLRVFDEIFPRREDFIRLYKFVDEGNNIFFKGHLHPDLNLNPIKFRICLEAMKETGLINVEERDNILMLSKNFVAEKVNLEETEILQKIISAKREFIKFAKSIFKPNFKEVLQ